MATELHLQEKIKIFFCIYPDFYNIKFFTHIVKRVYKKLPRGKKKLKLQKESQIRRFNTGLNVSVGLDMFQMD